MSNQFSLLKTSRFLPMFLTQFLGAFNDNLFKQSLVLLITAAVISSELSTLTNLAAILFILPYFIFSATAGQLADKFEKSKLAQYLKLAEIAIMSLATLGFFLHFIPLLLIALFLMGTHSTFFGPIKYGILPQLLENDELVGGNALFEMGTSLAILFGMIAAGFIMTNLKNPAYISAAVLGIAMAGYTASRFIPSRSISQQDMTIDWNFFRTTAETVRYAYNHKNVFYAILGISWFWYYGATFLTQIPQFTKEVLHGTDAVITLLLTIFSVGIAIGSLMCERITGHKISLKLVPFGAFGITVFAIDLFFSVRHMAVASSSQTISMILHNSNYYHIIFDLLCIGIFSGFYIVPLYAFMQAKSPTSHRARVIAANNIFNALFMVLSAIVAIIFLQVLHLSLAQLFLFTAILSALVSVVVVKKLNYLESLS